MLVIVSTADGQEHRFDNATAVSVNGVPLEEETTEQKWERFLATAAKLEDGYALYYDNHEDLCGSYKYGEWENEVGVMMKYGTLRPILASDYISEMWDELVSDLGSVNVEFEVDGVSFDHDMDASDLIEEYGESSARDEWVRSKDFYSDEDYKVSRERDTVSDFV
jgi:hypothetical protein